MHYFAPERPRLHNSELPLLSWGQPIPEPSLRPLAGGGWEINLMLGLGTSYWYSCEVAGADALLLWLAAWLDNPEEVITKYWPEFNIAPRKRAPQQGKRELSLDDLV